jgi:hypothetical protein
VTAAILAARNPVHLNFVFLVSRMAFCSSSVITNAKIHLALANCPERIAIIRHESYRKIGQFGPGLQQW